MKTEVVRARVPEKLKKEFEAVASAHGWNLSHAIRILMNQYVKQEKEANQQLFVQWTLNNTFLIVCSGFTMVYCSLCIESRHISIY